LPKTVVLKNDFHNSSVTIRVPADGVLSIGQTKRINRELCGIKECTCGGIRGEQDGIPDGFCVDEFSILDQIVISEQPDDLDSWSLSQGCEP
jgi:hypothetical protein